MNKYSYFNSITLIYFDVSSVFYVNLKIVYTV